MKNSNNILFIFFLRSQKIPNENVRFWIGVKDASFAWHVNDYCFESLILNKDPL